MLEDAEQLLTYRGEAIDSSLLRELKEASSALGDREELHRRMARDGYLYLPGFLDREEVMAARMSVLSRLSENGMIDHSHPLEEGVLKPGIESGFSPDLARDNPELDRVVYSGPMIEFYEIFLGGPVRHFDYTWFRAKGPNSPNATHPHCDIVFMGRGTRDLYTSWTPLQDIPYGMGGLMILEGSHLRKEILEGYARTDVDAYCDEGEAAAIVARAQAEDRQLSSDEHGEIRWDSRGHFPDALGLREQLGGRWLSTEYRMGDLLVFSMFTMHASTDNRTRRIRLSSDTRYQLAGEPVDERWIGDDPPAHGIHSKRGLIC